MWFGWCWVGGSGESVSLRRDVFWDSIVGRGKVSHWGWLLERRGFHLFYLWMWRKASLPYVIFDCVSFFGYLDMQLLYPSFL